MKKHLQHLQNHLKVGEVIPCRYWEFGGIDNKHDLYRGEDCTEKFCESLREHTMKTADFQKKKMIPLTSKEYESCLNQTNCHICIFALHVVYAIQNIVYLRKFLWLFTVDLSRIIILS